MCAMTVLLRSQNRLALLTLRQQNGIGSQENEVTRDESSDIAEEVHKSLLVEERLFSACYQQTPTWKQRKEFKEKKVEDCAWTPVIDETMLKFLESVEHKSGWYPFENGHAQVAYRAKALRTPDPYYGRKKFHLRTSIVKRKGVWWLLEMNHDLNKGKRFHQFGRRS